MSSTSYTTRIVTGASTNLTRLSPSPALNLHGWCFVNTAAYVIFVKFYWFVSGTATAPTVGTTLPNMTVGVPVGGTVFSNGDNALNNRGDLWVACTQLAVDTDTTATAAGDGLLTFILA